MAATNPGEIEMVAVIGASITVAIGTLVVLIMLQLWLESGYRAGLATTWVLILFFSFGIVCQWAENLFRLPDGLDFSLMETDSRFEIGLSVVWAILLVVGLILARRLPFNSRPTSVALNLFTAFLLAMVAVQWILVLPEPQHKFEQPLNAINFRDHQPDIYFIVLDGYARADVLRNYYDFDNEPFVNALRSRGFMVQDASTSNYYWTDLSLASILNFDYISTLLGPFPEKLVNRKGLYRLIRDNSVARILRARGYRFVQLQSTWGATGANPFVDEFISCRGGVLRDDYLRALAQMSWLHVVSSSASLQVARCHLNNFERLGGLARESGPKFVFAHFLPPHHPYLFDRQGNVLRDAHLSDQFEFQGRLWSQREPYLAQLEFVNMRMLEAIDHLIAGSDGVPVIMVQSDHGPSLDEYEAPERRRIRFATLSAVLLPTAQDDSLPSDMSAVNLFPYVLNRTFDAGLPVREPRYFTSEFKYPFKLREVGADGKRLE
jgi:hypothetical protein